MLPLDKRRWQMTWDGEVEEMNERSPAGYWCCCSNVNFKRWRATGYCLSLTEMNLTHAYPSKRSIYMRVNYICNFSRAGGDLLSWSFFHLSSPANLLGFGVYHENHQICQVHGARRRSQAAALLHHRPAGPAVRTPPRCGDQRHPGEGESWRTSSLLLFVPTHLIYKAAVHLLLFFF